MITGRLSRFALAGSVAVVLVLGIQGVGAAAGGSADLSVAQATSSEVFPGGSLVAYTMTVANAGPDAATGVTVVDTIPADATVVSASASQGTCNTSTPATCILGSLAAGRSAIATFTVDTPCAPETIINGAGVVLDQADPDPSNNESSLDVTLTTPCLGADEFVEDGGFVTTDPLGQGPQPDEGVFDTSSITVPAGTSGEVSISLVTTNPPPPPGICPRFSRLIVGTIEPAAVGGTWLTFAFTYDACSIPPGTRIKRTTMRMSADGITYTSIPRCKGGYDEPDPCVASKVVLPDGSFQYTVRWSGTGDPSWRPG